MITATDEAVHCAQCGHVLSPADDVPPRFGERFCSEAHAGAFVAGVRAARMERAAGVREGGDPAARASGTSAPGAAGPSGGFTRALCWGAPLLALLGALVWASGWAPSGGALLTGLALLACPLGMYFMMRSMASMPPHDGAVAEAAREKRGA